MVKANNAHYSASRRSGLKPLRLYDSRHTLASRMGMSRTDLVTLAALLGHSHIQMVMRCGHPTQERQFEAVKKLEELTARKGLKVA